MSEAVLSPHPAKTSRRWLNVVTRVLVALLMVITLLGFLLNIVALVGVWVVYTPARNAVTDTAATMTRALTVANNGLTRVSAQVQNAQQTVTQVNDAASKLSDRIQANSPIATALSQRIDSELLPRVENVRSSAVAIHDSVVSVNSTLTALKRLPGVTLPPALSNVLSSVSDRAQEAQAAVEDLRVTWANIKAGTVAKADAAITRVTSRINAALTRIQDTVNTYQAKVTDTQQRVNRTRDAVLLLIVVGAVSMTLLLIIFDVGLLLLLYVCLVYVRTGHFPSLRVVNRT